jgi:hypothetical protein
MSKVQRVASIKELSGRNGKLEPGSFYSTTEGVRLGLNVLQFGMKCALPMVIYRHDEVRP